MGGVVAAMAVAGAVRADDTFKPPTPTAEHDWLKKFVGNWETHTEMIMGPGQPPIKTQGTESVTMIGELWMTSQMTGECFGTPMTGIMTVGYDPKKQKYVGTWICTMCDFLTVYEGTRTDNTLTLLTEGPNPADPTKKVKMKDVCELKGPDERVLKSYLQTDDGTWVQFLTMTSKRKP
jgi:hypothetical protein